MKVAFLGLAVGFLALGAAAPRPEIVSSSWISPEGTFPANHASTLAELPGNEVLACWYAGSREGGKDVQIFCSKKPPRSDDWSAPAVVVANGETSEGRWMKNKTVGNPVLFLDPQNTLWLFYTTIQIGGWAGGKIDYKTSRDFGRTWSKGRVFINSLGNLTRTKPVLISASPIKYLMPFYHEFTVKDGFTCLVTFDQAEIRDSECQELPGDQNIQPALVQTNGKIFGYFRDRDREFVHMAEFNLEKRSWSDPIATNLPNSDSSIDASVDSKGRVLLVFNDSNTGRSPLTLAGSLNGKTFTRIRNIEDYKEGAEYSYPAFIKASSGNYYLSYTYGGRAAIKFIEFRED